MKTRVRLFLCTGILLAGCGLFGSHKSTETTTTTTSEVSEPGTAVPPPAPTPVKKRVTSEHVATASPSPSSETTPQKTTAATTSKPSSEAQFPTAKPVPGKPGFVFDPFNPDGGYIDVSGYTSGSKVKDPETKKIFIVP